MLRDEVGADHHDSLLYWPLNYIMLPAGFEPALFSF